MNTSTAIAWIHACHCADGNNNAVIVKEKHITERDGVETTTDALRIYQDPIRPFYITKMAYRTHEFKKEFEEVSKLDRYEVRDSQLIPTLADALGVNMYRRLSLRRLCKSPYVYGADVDTGALIRARYVKEFGDRSIPLTAGCLDIENEVKGDQRINAITFIHEREIFTALHEEYFYRIDETGARVPATMDQLKRVVREQIGSFLLEHKFRVTFFVGKELACIKWIFDRIKEKKTDFIGVWNIRHDIPHILDRIKALGGDAVSIMCHPDVPRQYQYVRYNYDNGKKEHIVDRWDWFECPGYSQFVDTMCLYGRIRKSNGRLPYYSLDYISNLEIKTGKLHFSPITNHTYEQMNNFLVYVAYNINDCAIMQVMEWKNHDYSQLLSLSGVTMLKDYSKQMTMNKNRTYIAEKEHGRIIASAGESMLTKFDALFPKLGGAVLSPSLARDIGTDIFTEDHIKTQVVVSVDDLDVSSEYPSIISTFNISKDTKLNSAYVIEGHPQSDTENYFSEVTSPVENAVPLCHDFFNLPNHTEMKDLFEAFIKDRYREPFPERLNRLNAQLTEKTPLTQ